MMKTSLAMKQTPTERKGTFIGKCQALDLPTLVPLNNQDNVKVLALGNLPSRSFQSQGSPDHDIQMDIKNMDDVDYLVVPASGNRDDLIAALTALTQDHPTLKIILADSSENPMFSSNDPPHGLEAIVLVSCLQGQAGRGLLARKAGVLAGVQGGRAAFLTALLADKLQDEATIVVSLTNFNQQIVNKLQI